MLITPLAPWGTAQDATTTPALIAYPTTDMFYRQAASVAIGDGLSEVAGYTLHGVRGSGAVGSAILGKDKLQIAYLVGSEIAPGIRLQSVTNDSALLLVRGDPQRLQLPAYATVAATPARSTLPAAAVPTPAAAGNPEASAEASPVQLLESAGLRREADGGYALMPRGQSNLLNQAGLKAGDVVLSLDGRPLNAERMADLKRELSGRAEVTLQYRRDGRIHNTTLKAPR